MKFKNIKVGMLIQHKMTGEVFEVTGQAVWYPTLDKAYYNVCGNKTKILSEPNALLFRKYKGD